jgi:hypothetical protein
MPGRPHKKSAQYVVDRRHIAHLSLVRTKNVEVYFDAIVTHSLDMLRRVTLFLLFINIHRNFVTQILSTGGQNRDCQKEG